MLIPDRHGDANVRAAWLFPRNDAYGNAAGIAIYSGPSCRFPECDLVVIGETAESAHNEEMVRVRLLAGLLGCLAVLAASLPVAALASIPTPNTAPMQTAASEPCSHCPDCDSAPCQPAAAGCVLACVAAQPTLGVAVFALPAVDMAAMAWPALLATLHGLSSPPDPFPPRL